MPSRFTSLRMFVVTVWKNSWDTAGQLMNRYIYE
jgi:hypothetical protein